MDLAVQINGAGGVSQGGARPTGAARGALESPDARREASAEGAAPDTAARPGPPVARLDLRTQTRAQTDEDEPETPEPRSASREEGSRSNARSEKVDEQGLTEADRRTIEQLKRRDREVREHERAHASAGGSIAGSPTFKFTRRPDGRQYAVGGEVSIDASPVPGNPQATIRKLEQVKRAALAPRTPSGQDRSVASSADAGIIQAKKELADLRLEAQAERRQSLSNPAASQGDSIGQSDPVFDPSARFASTPGGVGRPLGTGLAGAGELKTNVGLSSPGLLFSLVA